MAFKNRELKIVVANHPLPEWTLFESVRRYARLFVPNEETADIAVETWLRILRYPSDQHLSFPLARTIAKRVALDRLRSEKRYQQVTETSTSDPAFQPTQQDPFALVDLRETLRSALTQEEMLILLFSYEMEMTLAEIASSLGRPLSTVSSIRTRALQKARQVLEKNS